MGIFAGLLEHQRSSLAIERRNSLENPSVPLSLASFLGWLGAGEPTASGEIINVQNALQITDVQICNRIITDAVSSLPLTVLEVHDDGRSELVDHDLAWRLNFEPNPEMSAPSFWAAYVGGMALAGNGYAEVLKDGAGRAAGLYPLSPGVTSPRRNAQTGDLEYVTTSGMAAGRERRIPPAEVSHCPLFSFDGLKGFSPITLARQTLGLAKAAEKFGAKFFGNGAVPLSVFTPEVGNTVSPEKAAQLKESFERNYGGENALRTAVLTGAWKLQTLGLSPEDMQFILTQQFGRTRVAALFGVPPHKAGDTTRLSNANHENQELQFMTDTIRPYLNRIEKELTRKLLPRSGPKAYRYVFRFDVTERMRGDFVTTQQGFALGRQWGWLSANDVRRALGMNPGGPELDIYLSPLNMLDADEVLNPAPKKSAGANGEDPDDEDGGAAPGDGGEGERKLMARYVTRYGRPFAAAFQRAGADLERLRAELQPVIAAMADAAIHRDPFNAREDGAAARVAGEAIEGVLRRLKRKAPGWAPTGDLCRDEFQRAVRTVHIRGARESAGLLAARQLSNGEEEHGA